MTRKVVTTFYKALPAGDKHRLNLSLFRSEPKHSDNMKALLILLLLVETLAAYTQEHRVVKIKSLQSKPIVEVTLNGKKAYFIIDTGADISVINAAVAEKYGFETVKDYSGYTAKGISNHDEKFMKVKNALVLLDSVQMRTEFFAFDMEHLAKSIEERTTYRVVGIIGADLLVRYGFVIDYGTRMLRLALK
jgi:hypothetical protein